MRAAEAAVKTGLRGDALRDDLFGRVGFWWTPVLARARARIDEAITRRDNASSSTTPSGTSSTTSTVSPDEPRLRQHRSSPLPTASVVTGALVVSAVRPDGSSFPAGDSIDCAVRNVVDDADHFDVIPRCTVPLDELAGTWQDRNAFSYGRGDKGQARPEVLASLLGSESSRRRSSRSVSVAFVRFSALRPLRCFRSRSESVQLLAGRP